MSKLVVKDTEINISRVNDEDYLCLTSKNNILTLWNQETSEEGFEVKGSLTSHYDVDFISNLFFGTQYLSINKEMLAIARKANTKYTAW